MKLYTVIIIAFLSLALYQCKPAKQLKSNNTIAFTEEKVIKLETKSNLTVGQVYFKKWVGGQKESGSGVNIFFTNIINKNNYTLKQVYFRGLIGHMQKDKLAYFSNLKKPKKDINMTNKKNGEFGNTMPNNVKDFPFELKNNQCVISYLDNKETKYIKLDNIEEKETLYYPSAPPINNED